MKLAKREFQTGYISGPGLSTPWLWSQAMQRSGHVEQGWLVLRTPKPWPPDA